jgi:hypothetical protein
LALIKPRKVGLLLEVGIWLKSESRWHFFFNTFTNVGLELLEGWSFHLNED